MSGLKSALAALGYEDGDKQVSFIQLYHASGALGGVPEKTLTKKQALQFLENNSPSFKFPTIKFRSSEAALEWLNKVGQEQKKKFRPDGTERQQMVTPNDLNKHKDFIMQKLKELGFINELTPPQTDVAALLILGATDRAVKIRLDAAAEMIKTGKMNPTKIIIVGGARDLWPVDQENNKTQGEDSTLEMVAERIKEKEEYKDKDLQSISAEVQSIINKGFEGVDLKNGVVAARAKIVEQVSQQYGITWPTETDMMERFAKAHEIIGQINIGVVNAPKLCVIKDGKEVWERPNTKSTLEETVKVYGGELQGKNIAVMSSQPYAGYQEGVVKTVMGPQYNICMAAPGVNLEGIREDLLVVGGLEAVFSRTYGFKDLALAKIKEQEKMQVNEGAAAGRSLV